MAGESLDIFSSWVEAIGSSAPGNGSMDTGTRTALSASALSPDEQRYGLADFEIVITSGSPNQNSQIDLYRIPNGNAPGRTPSPAYLHEFIDRFLLDSAPGSYYIYNAVVGDPDDTYITQNNGGGSLTYSVNVRTRTKVSAT